MKLFSYAEKTGEKQKSLQHLNCFEFPAPTNIYSLSTVSVPSKRNSKLAFYATCNNVYCVYDEQKNEASQSEEEKAAEIPGKVPITLVQELPLSMITADADIIGIHVIYAKNKIVLAVAISQFLGELRPPRCFLNIYWFTEEELISGNFSNAKSPTTPSSPSDLGQMVESFELPFVPLQLTSATVRIDNMVEQVFLLSGNDKHVHCYIQEEKSRQFIEVSTLDLFPELRDIPASVCAMDILETETTRILAIGCQNGYLRVAITPTVQSAPGAAAAAAAATAQGTNAATSTSSSSSSSAAAEESVTSPQSIQPPQIFDVKTASVLLDGPISSLKLFRWRDSPSSRSFSISEQRHIVHPIVQKINATLNDTLASQHDAAVDNPLHHVNLAVGEAIGRAILFKNVEKKLLTDYSFLVHKKTSAFHAPTHPVTAVFPPPQQQQQDVPSAGAYIPLEDSVLSINALDIDADGNREILVGTYMKNLFVFHASVTSVASSSSDPSSTSSSSATSCKQVECTLHDLIKFPSPIFSIKSLDINSDGIRELLVSSMYSLHILQPNLKDMRHLLHKRLEKLQALLLARSKQQQINNNTSST